MRTIIKPVSPPESAADGGSDARRDLEQAARSGAAIPAWLEDIITDAGCDHYANIAGRPGTWWTRRPAHERSTVTKYRSRVTKIRFPIGIY